MHIRSNPYRFEKYKKVLSLISIVVMFSGLSVALLISYWSRLLGVSLFLLGGVLLYFSSRIGGQSLSKPRGFIFPMDKDGRLPIISERIVNVITFDGKYPQVMLIGGVLIAGMIVIFNLFFTSSTYLGSNDYVVLMLALSIGSYQYIPRKYAVERDFMLMFLFLLFLIVVIPSTYYAQTYGTTEGGWEDENPDSPIIHYLLARPLAFIMNTFSNLPHVEVKGVLITYHDINGERLSISIALGCTGLYSASIFLSAFIAYILVEYRKIDTKVLGFLSLGILTSYIANLLRMSIILMVGYYYGMDALLQAHKNVGELLFMFWIAIFWGLMFKYLDINVPWDDEKGNVEGGKKKPDEATSSSAGEEKESSGESKEEAGKEEPDGEENKGEEKGQEEDPDKKVAFGDNFSLSRV